MYSCPNDKHCTMLDYFMQLWFNNMCEINTLISKVIIFFFLLLWKSQKKGLLTEEISDHSVLCKPRSERAPSPHVVHRSALWSARGPVWWCGLGLVQWGSLSMCPCAYMSISVEWSQRRILQAQWFGFWFEIFGLIWVWYFQLLTSINPGERKWKGSHIMGGRICRS